MNFYPLHSVVYEYKEFTEKELSELRESVRKHGILVPIVIWNDQIVDGRHRYNVACGLGVEPIYLDITAECPDEASMRARVKVLNEHRRADIKPTRSEKEASAKAALMANPELSNRQIAAKSGVSHTKASQVRTNLEATGKIVSSEKTVGADGKSRPARKPSVPKTDPGLTPAENYERHASHERSKFVNAPAAPSQKVDKVKDEEVLGLAYSVRRLTADDRIVTLCNWIIDRLTH